MKNFRARFYALLFLGVLTGCGPSTKLTSTNAVPPTTTTVALSGTTFDFGENLVGNPISQTVVTVSNTGAIPLSLNPAVSGDPSYTIVTGQSCGAQLAAGSSCAVVVSYSPVAASAPAAQMAMLNLNFGNAVAGGPATVSLTGMSAVMTAGTVTQTANPQVALYTVTPPFAGNVTISFGTSSSYGLQTWSQPTPSGGGPVGIYVAGMLASTAYHMQATVAFENGVTVNDTDHTFTTGAQPKMGGPQFTGQTLPQLMAYTPAEMTPQPGIELVTGVAGPAQGLYATDLKGNVIWTYPFSDEVLNAGINGAKMLSNGHLIIDYGASSEAPLSGPNFTPVPTAIREIDLAGNTVREITLAQLNTALAANGFANLTLADFHHDIEPLPNGHLLVMANTIRQFTNLQGYTGTTNVLGDVVVDLDANWNPVWVWNEFDHLDVNRHPYMFPDWTHSNAILYSPDDGNFIVSIRHQNWLVKVNYANGTGEGNILWKLGEGGDFTLKGGTDPTDWFYAQHGPSFAGASSAGIFNLVLMDNGDDREFPTDVTCGAAGAPACLYSTVPIMQIDESAKTATLTFHQIVPPTFYNSFGGNAQTLKNGNVEYDLCGIGLNSDVFEVTQDSQAHTVWNLHSQGTPLYRAFRLPSLYPGVQW